MHAADIVASLRKKKSGVRRVAAQLDVHPGTVSGVISGRDTSRRIAAHISQVLGKPMTSIWPNKYQPKAKNQRAA